MSETLALSHGIPASIREGEILGGKYRLEREIGRGAMGTVWSAIHLTLGQRVAIKLIAAEYAQSPEARRRFSTEAKAAARLRSRYVVQVYDDGETPAGTPYIVLEYLDGETLEQRLERERDVPLNDAVRITRHVARALSRAHAQGIVHRDLKPGNVFLARSEDDEFGWLAKVLDFGIAKVEELGVTSTTKTGTLLGTPLFMSPEQVRGSSSVDARSDLYSLGMVFYNMLTGAFAFNGDSFADVLVAICTGPLPDLRAVAPWVPASVAEWHLRACAREAQDRFQSADEMVEALDLALGVSTGAFSRQSQGEPKVDTLRGHAPPVAHSLTRSSSSADSGEFAKGSTQVLATDPKLLKSNHVTSARTLDPELTVPTDSRLPIAIGAGVALFLLVAGAALLLGRSKLPAAPLTSASAPSGAPIAALPPTLPVPLAEASAQDSAVAVSTTAEPSAPPNNQPAVTPEGAAGSGTSAARPAGQTQMAPPGQTEQPGQPAQTQQPLPTKPARPAKPATNAGPSSAAPSRNTPTDIGF